MQVMRKYPSCAPEKQREYYYRYEHGLELSDLKKMQEAQDHRCGICDRKVSLQVDHDHETEKIRGLLCWRCNSSLGQLSDNVEKMCSRADEMERRAKLLRRQIAYLEKSRA